MTPSTETEKYRQMKKEALFTFLALAVLIVFWLAAGFGLARFDVTVFQLPLWALTSSLGVWFFALLLVKLLLKFVFKDMDLADGKGASRNE